MANSLKLEDLTPLNIKAQMMVHGNYLMVVINAQNQILELLTRFGKYGFHYNDIKDAYVFDISRRK